MKLIFHISGEKNKLFNNCWGNRLGVCKKKKNTIGSQPKYLTPESLLGEINILRRKMSKRHSW